MCGCMSLAHPRLESLPFFVFVLTHSILNIALFCYPILRQYQRVTSMVSGDDHAMLIVRSSLVSIMPQVLAELLVVALLPSLQTNIYGRAISQTITPLVVRISIDPGGIHCVDFAWKGITFCIRSIIPRLNQLDSNKYPPLDHLVTPVNKLPSTDSQKVPVIVYVTKEFETDISREQGCRQDFPCDVSTNEDYDE